MRGFPNVQFRHFITPKAPLGDSYVPIFDGPEETEFLIRRGMEDGEFYFGNNNSTEPNVKSSLSGFEMLRKFIESED